MSERSAHWDRAYGEKDETGLSWFDREARESFGIVTSLVRPGQAILDVGGGASRLADRLLAAGYGPVDVLDVSETALGIARARLGDAAGAVGWILADVTRWTPERRWRLWHDRAVFHFLTEERDRAAYLRTMALAVEPGGHAVISTFAEDGPERCSGLPVARYAPDALAGTVAGLVPGAFSPVSAARHVHVTPAGAEQRFQTSVFRRRDGGGAT